MEANGRRTTSVMRWYFVSFGFSMLGTGLWLPLNDKDRLASYTAAVSTTFALGMIVGPPISLPTFAQLGVNVYWLLILVGLKLGLLAVRLAQNNARAVSLTPVQVHDG